MRITKQDRSMRALIARTQLAAAITATVPLATDRLRYRAQPEPLERYSGDLRSRFPIAGRAAAPAKDRTPPNTHSFQADHRYRRAKWYGTPKRTVTLGVAPQVVCRRRAQS